MQRDMPLTSLGGDNALSVGALASSENLTGLKTILSVHFYVFTQPGPKADIRIKEWSCPYGQKNSSSLAVSEKLNLFNGNEFKEGTTFRLFPPHGLMYTYPSR